MASASRYPLWVKDNPEEQGIVNRSTKYSKLLIRNTAELCTTIMIVGVWIYLVSLGVVNRHVKADLQSRATNEDQVAGLLDYLLNNPCWKLHAFFRALCMSDQAHILTQILLLNPEDYTEDQDYHDQATHIKQLKREIESHHGFYMRTLMRGTLFDIRSLDEPYNMEDTYLQLLLTSDERSINPESFLPADVLRAKPGKAKPKTVLLSGNPGAGKSSFVRCFAYKSLQRAHEIMEWDLIVILNISTLALTKGLTPMEHIREAIQQSLEGRGDKEAIMRSLDDDSLNILIIPDGMDENRSPTILAMLQELISSCFKGKLGYTVLSTCRTGLSPIMAILYDRRVKIDGFKRSQGLEYVQTFYRKVQKPDDDSMFDYIANNQEDLDHILTNPLCTHILSVVTSDGTLKLVKGERLKLTELFQAMEKSMRRRQLEKMREGGSESVWNEKQMEDETRHFYNMSVWTLLKDVKTIDDELLSIFRINAQHPYLTFMKKMKTYNADLKHVSHWKFNHEAFHEYFSTCALKALPDDLLSAILLTISSNEKFRNTQRILFSALGGDIDQVGKLSDMICVNLITQGDSSKVDRATRDLIEEIQKKALTDIGLDDLLSSLIPGRKYEMSSKAQVCWQAVRNMYEEKSKLLQQGGLLHCTVKSDFNVIQHIYDCLHELPEEHQQLVFAESLGRTLPSIRLDNCDYRLILYNTGGMRWSVVREYGQDGVEVDINHSLTDACEAVQQYGGQQQGNKTRHLGRITLDFQSKTPRMASSHDQLLSTTLWSKLLSNVSDWPVTAGKLNLRFDNNLACGVKGFLQSLQLQRTQDVLQKLLVKKCKIEVYRGEIDDESLLAWTDWYLRQDLLRVQLMDLTHLKSDRAPVQRRMVHLRHTTHKGRRLFTQLDDTMTKELCNLQ